MTVTFTTVLMQCPKCGQKYPEGMQRFCDADGARLISDNDAEGLGGRRGVFSKILPQIHTPKFSDELAEVEPRFEIAGPDKVTENPRSDLYFETDEDEGYEIEADSETAAVFEIVDETADDRVFGRKIDPNEIPPGHIEIEEGETAAADNPEFDANEPYAFVGRRVKGRYQITEMLGEDDTGFAYLAEDRLVDGKRVMVRILAKEDLDEITEGIFAEERVSLSHLNHPNIVRLIDSGEFVDGSTFLITEHLDDLSLLDILEIHGPLTADRVARLIRQAGQALSDAHQEGILHRDLRPEFIIVSHEDEIETVQITEFGVSAGGPNADNLLYKAPEMIEGVIPTIAGDIYSLGVIAFQILTGETPFMGETERELLRSQREGLLNTATDLRRDISGCVNDVFDRVLSFDPLERYSTAREFGEALFTALTEESESTDEVGSVVRPLEVAPVSTDKTIARESEDRSTDTTPLVGEDLAWTRRSPEPPATPDSKWLRITGIGVVAVILTAAAVWYYVLNRPAEPEFRVPTDREAANPGNGSSVPPMTPEQTARDIEVPPLPRDIKQPSNTDFYQNSKQNLKGDLIRNFVGFSVFYPKEWKAAGPQESADGKTRGKFLDVSRSTPDGKLQEQMLVSYYTSNGTYREDLAKFPQMVREANDTLAKLIPNYQMVSEGNTTVNGGWNAYEIRFQGSGTDVNGERLLVWGRRLFMPAARPGVRAGFEITLLATSYAVDVRSVDDVGTRGELAQILYTFEPSQNF